MNQQFLRLLGVFTIAGGAFLGARQYLIPATFGDDGHYRAAAVDLVLTRTLKYAGRAECVECHEDITGKVRRGFHKNLSCEGCHGAAAKHAEDPGEVKPFAPRDRKFCPLCHGYDPSRPTGFPQINPTAHNPVKPCFTCHNPHDPVPQRLPASCSACHAQIQRTTAVSSHALLQCTTCHTVPAQHKSAPRRVLPSKPETREFCGKCHGQGAAQKEAPKIDLTSHGGTYLCWQCHYPHLPEGRG